MHRVLLINDNLHHDAGETMQGYKTMADGQGGEKKLKKRDKKG